VLVLFFGSPFLLLHVHHLELYLVQTVVSLLHILNIDTEEIYRECEK